MNCIKNSGLGGKNGQKFEIFGGLDELYIYLLLSFHSAMVSVDFVPKQSPSGEILASVMHDFWKIIINKNKHKF